MSTSLKDVLDSTADEEENISLVSNLVTFLGLSFDVLQDPEPAGAGDRYIARAIRARKPKAYPLIFSDKSPSIAYTV